MTEEMKQEEVVVAQPTIVAEKKVSTLDDIKRLPQDRIANAQPFTLPGTNITVMLAKCSGTAKFVLNAQQLQRFRQEDEGNKDESKWLEMMSRTVVKSCVVDPVLDDEAVTALAEGECDAFEALVRKCMELSADEGISETSVLENFG